MISIALPMMMNLVGRTVKNILEAMITIGYRGDVTSDQMKKKNPLGPTGVTVAENVRRIRDHRKLAYTELAAKLEDIGRPIPTLGLRNIENQKRRVDADDLVALAVALQVSPITLLLPDSESEDAPVEVTGLGDAVIARALWKWVRADGPVERPSSGAELLDFIEAANPRWRAAEYARGVMALLEAHRLEAEVDSDGDDHPV